MRTITTTLKRANTTALLYALLTATSLHAGPTPTELATTLANRPKAGTLDFIRTDYNPPTLNATPAKPIAQHYKATWDGNNFVLQEIKPKQNARTGPIDGYLAGYHNGTYWLVEGSQLSYYQKAKTGPPAPNSAYTTVEVGRDIHQSILTGGLPFTKLEALGTKLKGITSENGKYQGEIKQKGNELVLTGTTPEGVTTRTVFHTEDAPDKASYPSLFDVYVQLPGEHKETLAYSVEIVALTNAEPNTIPPETFTPEAFITPQSFHIGYFTNLTFDTVTPNGPVAVQTVVAKKTNGLFFVLSALSLCIIAGIVLLKTKSVKQTTELTEI